MLQTLNVTSWHELISQDVSRETLNALESGNVIFLPNLSFVLNPEEQIFLSAQYADPKTKNISFDIATANLQGARCTKAERHKLSQMMRRYAQCSNKLLNTLLPYYQNKAVMGRTSFRPIEIASRKAASYRKDDTRLHVDAFPSTPLQGKRILRIFSNVNPDNEPRVWRLGAPFPQVVRHFYSRLKKPRYGSALFLKLFRITKSWRTQYDHYMLQLHNAMKADLSYQQHAAQLTFEFPAGSSWMVYTDQVPHAVMSGRLAFEQTFYLPRKALAQVEQSPCSILECFLQKKLL